MTAKWTAAAIPDLTGQTIVVTGATSGLGLVAAREFAGHGARVIVTGRNPDRLESALEAVSRAADNAGAPGPEPVQLDLASLASVRAAADEISDLTSRVDVLLNNAGVMATPRAQTAEGFELQIGTNHLGHFALTGMLLPLLNRPPIPVDPARSSARAGQSDQAGRVVTVSSIAHKNGRVAVDDLSFQDRHYDPWVAYAQSKLANLLFALELARRAEATDSPMVSLAAHPGVSATNLFHGTAVAGNPIGAGVNRVIEAVVSQSPEAGAWPLLFAATVPGLPSGAYFGPDGWFEARGHPRLVRPTASARNPTRAAELWQRSEELTGVHYDFSS